MSVDLARFLASRMGMRGCRSQGGKFMCQYRGLVVDERYGGTAHKRAIAACTLLEPDQSVKKWMFELANLTDQCSVDHILVMFELRNADVAGFACRFCPYVERLPGGIPDIETLARSAHIAILVPVHVLSDLIVDIEFPICVHERLCEAQHH